jgi:hypothetical protein
MTTALEAKALLNATRIAEQLESELRSLNVDQTVLRLYALWQLIARSTGAKSRWDIVLDGLFVEPGDKILEAAVAKELSRLRVR